MNALRTLGGLQFNPLARNFYLTSALEDHGLVDWVVDRRGVVEMLEMKELLNLMKQRVRAEDVDGVNMTVLLCFHDTRETYRLQVKYQCSDDH